jgi:ribosomal protection tetracycline resistance protein
VLAQALERARTWVCQPMAGFTLEVPSATSSGVVAVVRRLDGHVTGQFSARGTSMISGIVPVARVRLLGGQLPSLSMGEGVLETRPGGYLPVGDDPPRRERSSPSPLERDAWLAWLAKRL